ncbi:MAG: acyltransferase [Candidatus Auribacter fodinae]|jgi:acetyltransferase-like isoleucine patch superfamily enzyme|uniref:Acyltransferase n=1 Tax=Candidatus Auribacter fodinae TaxID=2093366 RepID=A0A3A4QX15_9BACT|nr:MAG: acyltransferase [Candidatus Auribacter fodinae]
MKTVLKTLFNLFCLLCVLPFYCLYRIEALCIKTDQPFQGMSQFFSLFPGLSGNYLRRAFYYLALEKSTLDCCISFGTIFSSANAQIGHNVYIGSRCTLGDVNLGDDVLLGSNVDIINGAKQHYIGDITIPIREQGGEYPKVTIGADTWIGNDAVVMCNIGTKCIIGAGSVVIKDVEDYSIAVGSPAKVIKKRN